MNQMITRTGTTSTHSRQRNPGQRINYNSCGRINKKKKKKNLVPEGEMHRNISARTNTLKNTQTVKIDTHTYASAQQFTHRAAFTKDLQTHDLQNSSNRYM